MEKYDLIVIGGGAGGLTVAAGAASLGAKVALIEKIKNLVEIACIMGVFRLKL